MMTGCASAQERVLSSVEVAEVTLPYGAALDVCRINAKKLPEGQQLKAYVTCEREETRKFCAANPAYRAAWAECLKVEQ